MAFVLGKQTSEMKTKSLRTSIRNLEIQDGEEVDVLRRPAQKSRTENRSLLGLAPSLWQAEVLELKKNDYSNSLKTKLT